MIEGKWAMGRPTIMTTSSLFALLLSSCLGCNGITGMDDFTVGTGPAEAGDAGDEAGSDTRVGTSPGDAGPDSEASPDLGSDSGPVVVPDADADGPPAPTQKRVFVTSESYTADLGGLAGADAKCQKLADAAKLGGTYKAWLSDSTTSAKTRLSHATVPYKLVDGTTIAADWSDLTSGLLIHAIDATEKGTKPTYVTDCGAVASVWSNTSPSGNRDSNFSCENWTSKTASDVSGTGLYMGRSDRSDAQWSGACSSNYCFFGTGEPYAFGLYCIEQ